MEAKAILRYARISPQKCRLVADTVRGAAVNKALNVRAVEMSLRIMSSFA